MAVVAGQVQAARVIVDMGDPHMFQARIRLCQAAGEEAPGLVQAVEAQRGFGTLLEHARSLG
jgi:hypothetical protein